jgi:hypothetical protein
MDLLPEEVEEPRLREVASDTTAERTPRAGSLAVLITGL